MQGTTNKPRCLCLYSNTYTQLSHYDIDLVNKFFEVFFADFDTVIMGMDCDLKDQIEQHSPDMIYYHSCFAELITCKEPVIFPKNYDAYPEIPRIATLGGDKHSPGNYPSYHALRKLGCQLCVCSVAVNGELLFQADDMPVFYRHQACPTAIFKDYGEEKTIPVGLFGAGFIIDNSGNNHYPWRKKVVAKILDRVPLFHAPRPGGVNTIKSSHNLVSEDYARMVNRCKVSLACGTEQNNILQKHFEIPACRTCLVTEESNILKEYGFKDMVNCVFADENNICDKLEYLFSNPEQLQKITDAGFELVQGYIDPEIRFNIFPEIYKLLKEKKKGEKIVQDSIKSFKLVPESDSNDYVISHGPDLIRKHWEAGFSYLLADDADSAMREFNSALSYVSYCSEALTGIGIVSLFSKNIQQAQQCFSRNIAHVQSQIGLGICFCDPVEVAYLSLIYLCANDHQKAGGLLNEMQDVAHPALSAMWAILKNDTSILSFEKERKSRVPFDFDDPQKWYNHFCHALSLYR